MVMLSLAFTRMFSLCEGRLHAFGILNPLISSIIPFFTWGIPQAYFLCGVTPQEKGERCGIQTHTLHLTSEGFLVVPFYHRTTTPCKAE